MAPLAPVEGVLSAGSSGTAHFFKTATALSVIDSAGEIRTFDTVEGPVLGSFRTSGEPFAFYFPASGQLARWNSAQRQLEYLPEPAPGALSALGPAGATGDEIRLVAASDGPAVVSAAGDLLTPPVPVDEIEHLGSGLYLLRTPAGLYAWRPGDDLQLLPLADAPAFQLFQRDSSGTETEVGSAFSMPPSVVGETSTASFRIRNNGVAAVTINRLSIDVTVPNVFSTFNQFYPPRTIAPGGFADFSIQFAPSSSGSFTSTLHVNDLLVTLKAQTVAAPTVEWLNGTVWTALSSKTANDLGTVERDATLERRLRMSPADTVVSLSGTGFTLAPDTAAGEYRLRFSVPSVGAYSGTLKLPGIQYTLNVTSTALPVPVPVLAPASGALGSAQQVKVTVTLAEAARYDTVGTLTLQFTPLNSTLSDDTAIAFLPRLNRQMNFSVPKGATAIDLGGDLLLQTGTTAGTISLTAQIGSNTARAAYRVDAAPAVISAAKFSIVTGSAEVVLTAYDNTHATSKLAFTFYLTSGQTAQPGRIESDVSSAFKTFFAANSGGSFTLRATFPVSGTVSEIAGVDVALTNSAGVTSTNRLSPQ